MIHGIGVDLVHTPRIARALLRFGERFAARILASAERADFAMAADPPRFVAKRFAAKEALAKAMGTGIGHQCGLRDITVTHDASGRPQLCCAGTAAQTLLELGVARTHLSLSDEREYAIACVVLEGP